MSEWKKKGESRSIKEFIGSLVGKDNSSVVLQSIQVKESLDLTDGRLLVSHNLKLIANLNTYGKASIFFNASGGESDVTITDLENVTLEKLDLGKVIGEEGDETVISDAIWCRSLVQDEEVREFEVVPTLVLLEKASSRDSKFGDCRQCRRYSGLNYLTVIQFLRMREMDGTTFEKIQLSIENSFNEEASFGKPISIDFFASEGEREREESSPKAKVRFCKIPVEVISRTFLGSRAGLLENLSTYCGCFSAGNLRILADNSMDSGFVLVVGNMVLLSLDLNNGCSLFLVRRFLLQEFRGPRIKFSGFALQSGWLASFSLEESSLLIWNYNQGIAFRRFKLLMANETLSVPRDTPVTLSFGVDMSKLYLTFNLGEGSTETNEKQLKVLIIDLNANFGRVFCAYRALKFLFSGRQGASKRLLDPGEELRKRLQISSGSIPQVQLDDEYSGLTTYPHAFEALEEESLIERIALCVSVEGELCLDSTNGVFGSNHGDKLTLKESGWGLLFNRNWGLEGTRGLFCVQKMNQIVLETIENIVSSSKISGGDSKILELFNIAYLELISAPLKKALEYENLLDCGEGISCALSNTTEEKRLPKSRCIREISVLIPEEELVPERDHQNESWYTDIIVSAGTILIQVTGRSFRKAHFSICFSHSLEAGRETGSVEIRKLEFSERYTVMIMIQSRMMERHHFVKMNSRTSNLYIGIFSGTLTLIGMIYSTMRSQKLALLRRICEYNEIDSCIVPLIQLEVGFEHEELKLIEQSLENTPTLLNIEIVRLAQNILLNDDLRLSVEFKRKSSRLFLEFCLEKIKYYSEATGDFFQDGYRKEQEVDEILEEISYYLSIFRRFLDKEGSLASSEISDMAGDSEETQNSGEKNQESQLRAFGWEAAKVEDRVSSNTETYIRDQVIIGRYPSLVDWYLRKTDTRNPGPLLEKILYQVYKLICSQSTNSLTLSIHMLRQIGINTTQFLKSVLFFTGRRDIRRRLINHLKHFGEFGSGDLSLIQFSTELESYYANNCYYVERNRVWTSLFTSSLPYDILTDFNLEQKEDLQYEALGVRELSEMDEGSHINNPLFATKTFPFGGLQALREGLKLNKGLSKQYIEDFKRISGVMGVSGRRVFVNKEGLDADLERETNCFSYPPEAIVAWKELRCCEIEDFDSNLELGPECSERRSSAELEGENGMLKNIYTMNTNIPEQEGNDFVRMAGGKLVSIKNSKCKYCLDVNDEEDLGVEEQMLAYETEHENPYIHEGGSKDGFPQVSQEDLISSNSSIPHSLTSKSNSIENLQQTANIGDHNSKRGDLTWLKLHRERKALLKEESESIGYLSHSLSYLNDWPFDISIRVVIEKTHLQICFVWNRILKGYQTPCKRNESLVYSLIDLMIKRTECKEAELGISMEVAQEISANIYIGLFGFIFSHYDWKNIPISVSYLEETLFLLSETYKIHMSFRYNLLNEVISLYFKSSPKFILDVFLNCIDSSGIIPIHHLKTDLLQGKIQQIDMDKFKNIKHIIEKCTGLGGEYGVALFRYYLTRSEHFTDEESLNTFLAILENSNSNETDPRKIVECNDYLNTIYVFLNRKQDIIRLSLRNTFGCLKEKLGQKNFALLVGNESECKENEDAELGPEVGMILVLTKYFNSYYWREEFNNVDEEGHSFKKDKRIGVTPYYILSVLFSLEVPAKLVLNRDLEQFLDTFFPSLLEVYRDYGFNTSPVKSLMQEQEQEQEQDSPSITKIVKMTYNESDPLVKMLEIYPEINKRIGEDPKNVDGVLEFLSEKLREATSQEKTKEDRKGNIIEDQEFLGENQGLPILHYVSSGRPFFAFHLLCYRHLQHRKRISGSRKGPGNELRQKLDEYPIRFPDLSEEEKAEIYLAVYSLAIRNFTRDVVVCSCILFISMLQLPVEYLCTDIKVARCIYIHQVYQGECLPKAIYDQEMDIDVDSQNSEKICEIWDLFLKFGPPKISLYLKGNDDQETQKELQENHKYMNSLLSVLKMLEEAAWASGDIVISNNSHSDSHCGSVSSDRSRSNVNLGSLDTGNLEASGSGTTGQSDQTEAGDDLLPHTPIWHLVATFCRIHGLPRSLTLLHELARRGDWVEFLQECDSQKCPIETVENIIDEYISVDPVLKLHLKIALKIDGQDTSNPNRRRNEFEYESNEESDYIIQLLEWDKFFYSIERKEGGYFTPDSLETYMEDRKNKILEFYGWSVDYVYKKAVLEMSTSRIIMHYSLIEKHCINIAESFQGMKEKIKDLANLSLNSFLLIELVYSIYLASKRENAGPAGRTTGEMIDGIFCLEKDDLTPEQRDCWEAARELFLQIFGRLEIQNRNEIFSDKDRGNSKEIQNYGEGPENEGFECKDTQEYEGYLNDEDGEEKLIPLLINFVQDTIQQLMEPRQNEKIVSPEFLDLLFAKVGSGSEAEGSEKVLIRTDEMTVMFWKLLSKINERNFLWRTYCMFYGKESQISLIFKSVDSLFSLDIDQAVEDISKVFDSEKTESGDERLLNIQSLLLPRKELIRSYFEQEFLQSYSEITIEDHQVLWNFIHEATSKPSIENNGNSKSSYLNGKNQDREGHSGSDLDSELESGSLLFKIKDHCYRKHIIDLLYFDLDEFQVTNKQFERWLCTSEKQVIEEFYDQKRYKLLLRYLETSSKNLIKDARVFRWLENSFLSQVAMEFEHFSTSQPDFKSSFLRKEYIKGKFWTDLLELSAIIENISLALTPLFQVKISIYCWYLTEKLERWFSAFDQVILISISMHFLFEALKVSQIKELTQESAPLQVEFVPKQLNSKYIRHCIQYAGLKLLLLLLSHITMKELKQTAIKEIVQDLSELVMQLKSGADVKQGSFEYNNRLYFQVCEEIFLKNKPNCILFTPSGHFNFKNQGMELPFNIQVPLKILQEDYPVDARNVQLAIRNAIDLLHNLSLASSIGIRYVPNIKSKLESSKQRLEKRFNVLVEKLAQDFNSEKTIPAAKEKNRDEDGEQSQDDDENLNFGGIYDQIQGQDHAQKYFLDQKSSQSRGFVTNVGRNLQAWDSIADYLVGIYNVSLIFVRITSAWSSSNSKNFPGSNFGETFSEGFNKLLLESLTGESRNGGENNIFMWREYLSLVDNGEKEISMFMNENFDTVVSYKRRLESILTLFQFLHQVEKVCKSRFSFYSQKAKLHIQEITQNCGLSPLWLDGNENQMIQGFEDSTNFIGVSKLILELFSSKKMISMIREILEISISLEYEKDEINGFRESKPEIIGFKTVRECCRVVFANNLYLKQSEIDDMFAELIHEAIKKLHSKSYVSSVLFQLCQLVLNPMAVLNSLERIIESFQDVPDTQNKQPNLHSVNSIRESLYLHLSRYFLVMLDFRAEEEEEEDDDDDEKEKTTHSQQFCHITISDSVSKITQLLDKLTPLEFDPDLFASILLEIPELRSLEKLNSEQINQILLRLELNSKGKILNPNSGLLPNGLLRLYISQRILEIYAQREARLPGGVGVGIPNIGLINTQLKGPDILSDFLVKKCLLGQWKRISIEYLYSKYGRYDLVIALQTIIYSCELLKSTNHQQNFRAYQNLAGLFSIQLYFTHVYSNKNNRSDSCKKPFERPDALLGVKDMLMDRLSCIIKKEEILELVNDLASPDYQQDLEVFSDDNRAPTTQSKDSNKNLSEGIGGDLVLVFEQEKIRLLDLDLIDLFELTSNPRICFNPSITHVILSGYELFYGLIVHSIWPRLIFKHSIILSDFSFLEEYKLRFGYLDSDIVNSLLRIHKNSEKLKNNETNCDSSKLKAFYEFTKDSSETSNKYGSEGDGEDHEINIEDEEVNIMDLALCWNERGVAEFGNLSKESIYNNWTKLIQEYLDDLLLRISTYEAIDETEFSQLIFQNKRLYNDKSLYKIDLYNE
ncbi:WD repeat protein [Cryptosporidium felis]|nr:WD repeat protein [Cryptosporidium felis]